MHGAMTTPGGWVDRFPVLVVRAQVAAAEVGMPLAREGTGPSACLPGVGRFLAVLAAGCLGGRIGEVGTGDRRLRERYAAASAAHLVQSTLRATGSPTSARFVAAHRRGRASWPAPPTTRNSG